MIAFVSGDILQTPERYIAQGVAEGNQEGLGTGLAFKISKKWPYVQSQFKRYARSGRFRGGDIWICEPEQNRPGFIYLATQPDMYHATLPYLRKAFKRLTEWAERKNIVAITLPKIGAGLGKLDWATEVKPLMIEFFSIGSCNFIVYEDYRSEYENT